MQLYLRLARAKQHKGGGKRQSEAGHIYHAKTMGASPGLPHRNNLPAHLFAYTALAPIPASFQNGSFDSLFLGPWSLTLKGDFLLHLSVLPQNRLSFPIAADSSVAPRSSGIFASAS